MCVIHKTNVEYKSNVKLNFYSYKGKACFFIQMKWTVSKQFSKLLQSTNWKPNKIAVAIPYLQDFHLLSFVCIQIAVKLHDFQPTVPHILCWLCSLKNYEKVVKLESFLPESNYLPGNIAMRGSNHVKNHIIQKICCIFLIENYYIFSLIVYFMSFSFLRKQV